MGHGSSILLPTPGVSPIFVCASHLQAQWLRCLLKPLFLILGLWWRDFFQEVPSHCPFLAYQSQSLIAQQGSKAWS